jgi:hypothetical protein
MTFHNIVEFVTNRSAITFHSALRKIRSSIKIYVGHSLDVFIEGYTNGSYFVINEQLICVEKTTFKIMRYVEGTLNVFTCIIHFCT